MTDKIVSGSGRYDILKGFKDHEPPAKQAVASTPKVTPEPVDRIPLAHPVICPVTNRFDTLGG